MHIIFNAQNIEGKEKGLKAHTRDAPEGKRKKHLIYNEVKVKITLDLFSETMQTRRELSDIFKVLKEKT